MSNSGTRGSAITGYRGTSVHAAGVRPGWLGAWAAVLSLACWLSQLAPMWLVVSAVGSAVWTVAVTSSRSSLRMASAALLWVAIVLAALTQMRLAEIGNDWDSLQPRVEEPLAEALGDALDDLVAQGETAAEGAAEAAELYERGAGEVDLFDRLDRIQRSTGVTAIALFDPSGEPVAWGGDHRGGVPEAARMGRRDYLYEEGPLYSYLYFIRPLPDGSTATAAFLLEAAVEAGEGVEPFADRFEDRFGARPRFWTPDRARPESVWDWVGEDDASILSVSFSSLTQQDWWLRTADLGRKSTAVVGIAAMIALCVIWFRTRRDASGVPLMVGTAAIIIAPTGRLLGAETLFSPLQFVLPGPLDVSLGTLLVFLAGFAIWLLAHTAEIPRRTLSPRVSVALLAVLFPLAAVLLDRSASDGLLASRAAGGFFLQMAAALLLTIPLFLVLRHARPLAYDERRSRVLYGLGMAMPVLFGVAVLLTWTPERQFPAVLAAIWAIPASLIALHPPAGRSRGSLRYWVIAGWLGTTAALAFLWPMHMRAEFARAERELAVLGTKADPFLDFLLRQFAETAAQRTAEGEGGVNLLYHSWVDSNLAGEGYEARMSLWRGRAAVAELNLSEIRTLPSAVVADVLSDRETPTVVHYGGLHGLHYLLVAPLPDSAIVSVAVPPRRRLGGATSLGRFLHPNQQTTVGQRSEMLYLVPDDGAMASTEAGMPPVSADTVHWVRAAEGWRSETIALMPEGPVHAHFVLAIPPVPLSLTRATLVVFAIASCLLALWFLARALCREVALPSPLSARWLRSFRGRLSIALFAFFLLPTVAFGAVSYSAVAREVIRSAAALAQQALDQAATDVSQARFGIPGGPARPDLLLYERGTLTSATAPEVLELGLFNTWLPPSIFLGFATGEEMQELEERRIADGDYLVAYRRLDADRVMAAPTPLASNEIRLRQREFRDVALFVILSGLGLSVVLSLVVGRALVRPLDELSRAATTVGRGNLDTRLPEMRRDEFGNVYESFNRMVGRLDRTRAALVQETKRTELIVAEAATGVLALDADGRVELINPRAAEILGGMVGTGDSLVSRDSENGTIASAVTSLLRSPAPESGTELDLDGRTVRMRLRRLSADEGGGGAVIAVEDVTAEMRTARVLAWGEMARQVAHEIKNPLTPIKLAVQHLQRAFDDGRADFELILDRNVGAILREIDRLSEISRAFSRFGTPAAVASPLEAVDIGQAIGEVGALYRGSDSDLEFRADVPASLPRAIARSGEIKEVLLNLLENAREAVGPGGRITISARRDEASGRLRIQVLDNGVGIPSDQLPSIFEPHFSTRSSGTGLGLAIVRRIVDSWGGEIFAESRPGHGTRFTVQLLEADSGQPPPPAEPRSGSTMEPESDIAGSS